MNDSPPPAMWLQNPFDWDGGWHVLVMGGPRPEAGEAVTVTRRDGSQSVEAVVAVVGEHRRYDPPAVWWLCVVAATVPTPGQPLAPVHALERRKGCLGAFLPVL